MTVPGSPGQGPIDKRQETLPAGHQGVGPAKVARDDKCAVNLSEQIRGYGCLGGKNGHEAGCKCAWPCGGHSP